MTIFSATANSFNEVSLLINKRLACMKDVAGFKAKRHLATEDLIQENRVLVHTLTLAKAIGLDGDSVKPFIIAQMNAAKAIQYRYRADWLSTPEIAWQPGHLDKLRPQIAMLSEQLLVKLHALLVQGSIIEDKFYPAFVSMIEQHHLSDQDKQRLFITLKAVQLNNKQK